MLDLGRYLLGAAYLLAVVGFAWLGGAAVRRRWVPELDGMAAQLASAVLAIALLLWAAELLGALGAFAALPYLVTMAAIGAGIWGLLRGRRGGGGPPWRRAPQASEHMAEGRRDRARGLPLDVPTLIALVMGTAAVVHFGADVRPKLSTGMTGFDSTWYHGPFAAGFFQSGDTWSLHFIAPQFLAWFYPANSEVGHAIGMLAFGRDVLSPLLNLGWFVGCLVAAWCIGRPYRVAPWSLALAAIALSVPALHDQAGEARNDIAGIFFLLSAVAIAISLRCSLTADCAAKEQRSDDGAPVNRLPCALPANGEEKAQRSWGVAFVGLAAGLAAGTKLNFLLPAGILVVGIAAIAPREARWRSLGIGGAAALAGGGYWYLRNLAHAGNPLPWVKHLGPIALPAPEQALGGREGHSVFGYLADGSVWSDWFLPGLHHGLTILWPLLAALALAGLILCLGRSSDSILRVAGLVGLAAALAWLIAPTSASGPDGIPRGFESGLRYLAPALVLGLAVLPAAPSLRHRLANLGNLGSRSTFVADNPTKVERARPWDWTVWLGIGLGLVAVAVGYPVQRHYLEHRYEAPSFTTPGLNAAFAWAQGIHGASIATTSTRQYPLYGRDLSNEVDYVGIKQPHGGFTAPTTCSQWRHLLNEGGYDYVVTTRDRIEPNKPTYPLTARWTKAPGATVILRKPPTVVFKLSAPLDPSACR